MAPFPLPTRSADALDYEGLRLATERALEGARAEGRSQAAIARELSLGSSSVTNARNMTGGRVARLQRRILAHLTGVRVSDEPTFPILEAA